MTYNTHALTWYAWRPDGTVRRMRLAAPSRMEARMLAATHTKDTCGVVHAYDFVEPWVDGQPVERPARRKPPTVPKPSADEEHWVS